MIYDICIVFVVDFMVHSEFFYKMEKGVERLEGLDEGRRLRERGDA